MSGRPLSEVFDAEFCAILQEEYQKAKERSQRLAPKPWTYKDVGWGMTEIYDGNGQTLCSGHRMWTTDLEAITKVPDMVHVLELLNGINLNGYGDWDDEKMQDTLSEVLAIQSLAHVILQEINRKEEA